MPGIKKKFISGVLWESVGRFSSLGIQFIVLIIIARVLSPADYGIIGLLTFFIALGQIFLDSGFSQALIQKKEADEIDFSSVFFLNMIAGVIVYLFLYFISPYIASFYKLPDLTDYARVLFLIIPINSFGLIQNVIIQKELTFKKTATASIVSALFSGGVGIGMAYSGFEVWALVWQQISLHASKTFLYIIQRRWVPIFIISIKTIKEMFAFSMNLMAHSIVNTTMKNIYTLIIGKYFSIAQVGYYNQATKFEEISSMTISQIVMKVSFPALVYKKDEPLLIRLAFSKIFSTTIFFIAPTMVFLMIVGEPLFRLLLTEKWLPAVPYLRLLCLYGMMLPLMEISYMMYKLFRKGRLLFLIDSFKHLLLIISIILTIRYGIEYMLIGQVICTVFMSLLNLHKSGALISFTLLDRLKELLPYYLTSGIVGFIVYLLPDFDSDFLTISFSAIVFLILYLVVAKLMKFEAYIEVISILKLLKGKFFR
jgi:teichuronic acid exporter